jgi:hypothetical protein
MKLVKGHTCDKKRSDLVKMEVNYTCIAAASILNLRRSLFFPGGGVLGRGDVGGVFGLDVGGVLSPSFFLGKSGSGVHPSFCK